MKNVFFKVTVSALMLSLSVPAFANRPGKRAGSVDEAGKLKDKTTQGIEKSGAALTPAGKTGKLTVRQELIKPLEEALAAKKSAGLSQADLSKAADVLDNSMVTDLVKGINAGGARAQVAEKAIKVAGKITSDDLDVAVLSALLQASAKRGKIFGDGSDQQITQANQLADKMLTSTDTRQAIVDFLSSKNGKAASKEEIEEFVKNLRECV